MATKQSNKNKTLDSLTGKIHQGDCLKKFKKVPDGEVDLVFADPPFNIGFTYDEYDDRLGDDQYLAWCHDWMQQVHRVLKGDGTFWLAIGDEYAAELKIEAQKIGFHCRSWVIWYYTFGVNCKKKFTRSHAHLFHFVKDAKNFVFNHEDLDLRVPSARRLIYNDARANPNGRMPDDTWILRPQELVDGFDGEEDTWHFPRVAGTFKERAGFHGCQMPEQLLGRVIRCSTQPGDVVLDPFSGSSTTLAVAKKLDRQFFGFELSKDYTKLGSERLNRIVIGDPLNGAAEPNMNTLLKKEAAGKSSKAKPRKKGGESSQATKKRTFLFPNDEQIHQTIASELDGIAAAYMNSHRGYSVERLVADPILNQDFQLACDRNSVAGTAAERNRFLFRIRKSGTLKTLGIETKTLTKLDWPDVQSFAFASEIAWRQITNKFNMSLDEIFCDPRIAAQFDKIAANFAPGYESLDYRWAAIMLRKELAIGKSRATKQSAKSLGINDLKKKAIVEKKGLPLLGLDVDSMPEGPGVYLVCDADRQALFAGEADQLARRMRAMFAIQPREMWLERDAGIQLFLLELATVSDYQFARQSHLVKWHQPDWNFLGK